ncbi:MAG: hypothetical protein HYR62_02030 [Actinobacteria bacterium]|nr:hypothetical protein [Actinomycetota bacterium]MBI3687262.1 hypothetical protein [Actinomycetota bacterium]
MTAAHARLGKATERAVAAWWRTHGFPGAERIIRTGWRTRDRSAEDAGDLDLCPGVIAQVKSLQPPARAERAVPEWMAETERQRVVAGAAIGLLIVRRPGTADVGEWFAWLPARTAAALVDLSWPTAVADAPNPPLRLTVADASLLLRWAGYGTDWTEVTADA